MTHNNTTTTYSTSVTTPVGDSYIISALGVGNGGVVWSNITQRYVYTNSSDRLSGASIDSSAAGTVNVSATGNTYGVLTTLVFS